MLELAANDPIIKVYLKDLRHLKTLEVTLEPGLQGPFQNLLDKAAKWFHRMLVPDSPRDFVRLAGQSVRVTVETVGIAKSLPSCG